MSQEPISSSSNAPRSAPPPGSGLNPLVIVDATDKGTRHTHRPPASDFGVWKALSSVFSVAMVVATLFTLWTPDNLFANQMLDRMFQAVRPVIVPDDYPTPTPSPRLRIGIVAGHWGHDPGAVCDDGLTEESVNLEIATMVKEILQKEGYDVDLLKEFDTRLSGYRAIALVSIHNDSCRYINAEATGFKVAAAASSVFPEKATRLTACLSQRYQAITGLSFHYNTVTADMTEYHAFNETHADTTAAIIETGFLNLDRDILTNKTDMVSKGVASGILCFVRNEDIQRGPEQ
jgi:N-acetylmuramoyl-L-alanine amidase